MVKKYGFYRKRMKILVVEDSITQAVAIQRILTAQGWEVALSRNGKEGLERIPDFQPDIVITDLVMPEMDGFEMCKALKESPQKHIPVILLSAIGEIESKIKGLNVGADDYLTKPVRELELMARISSTMRIKQYQDQLQQALQDQRNLNRQMLEGLAQAKVTQSVLLPGSISMRFETLKCEIQGLTHRWFRRVKLVKSDNSF